MGDSLKVSREEMTLLRAMDLTAAPKLATISAFLPKFEGARVLDVGCGTGEVTYQLALLNPHMSFVGLDYNQDFIKRAREVYLTSNPNAPANLAFICEDARTYAPREKYHVAMPYSQTHETFSFSGYSHEAVYDFFRSCDGFLEPGGIVPVRDFCMPDHPEKIVCLSLPDTPHALSGQDGCPEITYPEFLLWYAQNANRELAEEQRGFWIEEVAPRYEGWRSFHLPHRWAQEFMWRKEYLKRREPESSEQYAFMTRQEWWDLPARAGVNLRPEVAFPVYNPWMFKPGGWYTRERIRIDDLSAAPLPPEPSNFIIRYRKTQAGESLRFTEKRVALEPASYLKSRHYIHTVSGQTYDVVSRPGAVADILPYGYSPSGRLIAVVRSGYPRPIVNAMPRALSPNIDGKRWSGHMDEPLAAANLDGTDPETVAELLIRRSGFTAQDIGEIMPGSVYCPAPMDSDEQVRSLLVRMGTRDHFERPLDPAQTGFSTAGAIKTVDVQDMLRASRSGALPEPRLELNGYLLLLHEKIMPEPWFSADFPIEEMDADHVVPFEDLLRQEGRSNFRETDKDGGNQRIIRALFQEEARQDNRTIIKAGRELEFAVPNRRDAQGRQVSSNSALLLHLGRDRSSGEILAAIKVIDSPASQSRDGHSGLITQHGRYVPADVTDPDKMRAYLCQEYGLAAENIRPLGESYMPSMGILPGRIYPHLSTGGAPSRMTPLREIFTNVTKLRDMNLVVSVLRAVHALGLWEDYARPGNGAHASADRAMNSGLRNPPAALP